MRQIRFFQLKKGQEFSYNGEQYIRIKDIRQSCCVVKYNAKIKSNNQEVKLPTNITVEIQ